MNVVARALNVLVLIGEAQDGVSLTQASESLGYPLATVHRILKVLAEEDFVRRDPVSLEYHPGRRLQRMSTLARRETLGATAAVTLRELSEKFNETVMLTQLIDGRALCVALFESRRPLHLSVSVGQAVPLHAAASARVLYSGYADDEVRRLLAHHEFVRMMPGTPAGVEEVIEHLDLIRTYGYDVCDNEFDFGIWAAAAPIRDSSGEVVAGITLTTPQERSQPQQLRHQITDAVVAAADDISIAIGGPSAGTAKAAAGSTA